jgi:hypothetical protein
MHTHRRPCLFSRRFKSGAAAVRVVHSDCAPASLSARLDCVPALLAGRIDCVTLSARDIAEICVQAHTVAAQISLAGRACDDVTAAEGGGQRGGEEEQGEVFDLSTSPPAGGTFASTSTPVGAAVPSLKVVDSY